MSVNHRWAVALAVAAVSIAGSYPASAVAPTTSLVTVAPGGADGSSGGGSVSAGGHFVAFSSSASNLVPGDTNGVSDVFVRDTVAGTTERITAPGGTAEYPREGYGPTISADGRFVLFGSYDEQYQYSLLYLRDRKLQTTKEIASGDIGGWAMSPNGRYIGVGATRYVAEVDVWDRVTGKGHSTTFGETGDDMAVLSISDNGRTVLITNTNIPAYRVWKPLSGRKLRFDQTYTGGHANSYVTGVAVSGNGDWVLFDSKASNIVRGDTNHVSDVFVRNLTNGHTKRISKTNGGLQANGPSYGSDISYDGHLRLFSSTATNLVGGDTNAKADLFMRDSRLSTTTRCDLATDGTQADRGVYGGSLTPGGSWVAFGSNATNLVPGDDNGREDVFLRGPLPVGGC